MAERTYTNIRLPIDKQGKKCYNKNGVIKMPRTYKIDAENAAEIKEIRKGIKDKVVDKRLHAVQLRGEGMKNKEIAKKLDTSDKVVSHWVSIYVNKGILGLLPKPHPASHYNMTFEEEEEFLAQFSEKAEKGQIIEVSEIKRAYVEKVGHNISAGQIYRVLHRHGWRKIMPRSRHPKKADNEAIEASKKLNLK